MIESFKCKKTESFFNGSNVKEFESFRSVALRKLDMLKSAVTLDDLRSPPGNRLEALDGNRQGQNSIRINDQFRICFIWIEGSASKVEITDYH